MSAEFPDPYKALPQDIKEALNRWAIKGEVPSSHFLQAILENDFMKVMSHADDANRDRLLLIAQYVYNRLPIGCWGSNQKMNEWRQYLRRNNEDQ